MGTVLNKVTNWKVGNSTVIVNSALPSMSREEQAKWFEENRSLPQVRNFINVWIELLIENDQKQREAQQRKQKR